MRSGYERSKPLACVTAPMFAREVLRTSMRWIGSILLRRAGSNIYGVEPHNECGCRPGLKKL